MLQLQKQVTSIIKEYNLFRANDTVLLGVSGGPDSVALLSLIFDANRVNSTYSNIFIAHLNHLIRGKESEEDEQFVSDLAKKFKLSFVSERRDVKEIARECKMSLEEAAREERYKFFESAAERVGANVIAVGHNADDNAETILHRIIRGTGIAGLGGMKPKRKLTPLSSINLVRPLLFTWRKDIIAYLKEKNLSYRIDSTNFETDQFRNRIRAELIPLLEKNYNSKTKESLIKLGETAAQNYDFLQAQAKNLLEEVLLSVEGKTDEILSEIVLDMHKLKEIPQILQQIIIKEAVVRLNIPLKKLGYKNYKNILSILNYQKTPVSKAVKDYLNVKIEDGKLHLSKKKYYAEDSPVLNETVIKIPGETKLVETRYTVKMEIKEINNGFLEEFKLSRTKYDEAVDFDKISVPLMIRTRRPGDKFWPLGSPGIQKVKDFFINNKISMLERDTVPIVTMNGQPIWIVGFRIDDRIRVKKETKKLLIMKFEKC
ncbi:MAG: tRNA(Ile)-lysidine synthase [Candidatus Scalindua arabica]|uniref:tRNA(Ile)-lysidine synthase n=1 Tax=Candidatus Scalindua arabica TaxID=1127984 RepID=A0A942A3Z7_9BACT|nr:tRNA(Ile)-lysidine synthase [Candidatus Scalindua arabica]